MRFASPTVLTALFKMNQINIFCYCPDLVFEFYLMCPCIGVIDFNTEIIIIIIIIIIMIIIIIILILLLLQLLL